MFERRPHLLRDVGLYVVIGLLVVAVILIFAENGWGTGWSRWVALALGSCLIFYYWLKMCRPLWRRHSFWYTSLALLTLHAIFWAVLLRHFPSLLPTWFAGQLFVVELAAFPFLADWIAPLFKDRHPLKRTKPQ